MENASDFGRYVFKRIPQYTSITSAYMLCIFLSTLLRNMASSCYNSLPFLRKVVISSRGFFIMSPFFLAVSETVTSWRKGDNLFFLSSHFFSPFLQNVTVYSRRFWNGDFLKKRREEMMTSWRNDDILKKWRHKTATSKKTARRNGDILKKRRHPEETATSWRNGEREKVAVSSRRFFRK